MLKVNTEILKQYMKKVYGLEKSIYEQKVLANNIKSKISQINSSLKLNLEVKEKAGNQNGKLFAGIIASIIISAGLFWLSFFLEGPGIGAPQIAITFARVLAVAYTVISLIGIVVVLYKRGKTVRYNRAVEMENIENQKEFQNWQSNLLATRKSLREEFDIVKNEIGKYEQILEELYSFDILFPKYRNIVAVSSIFEYLEAERCYELTGHEGAYNLYENELRLGHIIEQLDDIKVELREIKENQEKLYEAIQTSNVILHQILDQEIMNGKALHGIQQNQSIIQYNQKRQNDRLGYLTWIEEQKYLFQK